MTGETIHDDKFVLPEMQLQCGVLSKFLERTFHKYEEFHNFMSSEMLLKVPVESWFTYLFLNKNKQIMR